MISCLCDGGGASDGTVRRHHASHRGLLRHLVKVPRAGRGRVGGIVVPTHRPAANLAFALATARRLGCRVVAVCGGWSSVEDVLALAGDVRCYAVRDVDALGFDRLPAGVRGVHDASGKQRNISAGRNLGLLVARLAGWRTVLFLDHDVDVGATATPGAPWARWFDVAASRIGPGGVHVVGWIQRHYPDNSVVCHANRLAGNPQGSFISTGALVTAVDEATPSFPPVYNEDWLFLHPSLAERRVALGGYVLQQRYDPFADPQRAVDEEFGDLLVEGLFHLLHVADGAEPGAAVASRAFWAREVEFRAAFVDGIAEQLEKGAGPQGADADVPAALRSLRAAAARLQEISPDDVVRFVEAWQDDARTWRATMQRLHPVGRLDAAFDVLHVPYETTFDEQTA